MYLKDNVYKFNKFASYPDLVHGFSTRVFGSMRPKHDEHKESMAKFAAALDIPVEKIVTMGQKHTNVVYTVTDKDLGQVIPETDSLATTSANIFLGVVTADCLPILIYDPNKKIVAAIHAGWRGLFSEVIKKTIEIFVQHDSQLQDLVVGIGPCIRSCCYEIAEDHKNKLSEKPEWGKYIIERDGKLFLDLPRAAVEQLVNLGIKIENIEDGDYCTFEHDDVNSKRKEGDDFGEIIGVIGVKA